MPSDAAPANTRASLDDVLSPTLTVSIPEHVVYRHLPSETVVFNLRTGKYHGLNGTAGRMLEALEQASSVRDAAAKVAEDYAVPQAGVEQDMCKLCGDLLARGLVKLDSDSES